MLANFQLYQLLAISPEWSYWRFTLNYLMKQKMIFHKNKSLILIFNTTFLITSIFLMGCEGKYNPRDHSSLDIPTDSLMSLKVKQDNVDVEPDPGSYTYIIKPEAMVIPVVKADSITDQKSESTVTKRNMAPIQIVVQSSQADIEENRPPLYGEECLAAEFPVRCSSDKLTHFVRDHLEFPAEATTTGYDGMEIVSIQITKEGSVEDIQVQSDKTVCKDCQTAAYSVIAALPDKWLPALENGKPVTSTVTIPIKFRTLN